MNGNRRGQEVHYLDGSGNAGSFCNSTLQMPNPDAVQGVSVTKSSTSAEFGKQPGGTSNVITGCGTLGGPVVRNKTFFFSSFQIYRDNSAGFQTAIRFRTQKMMEDNFSQFASPVCDPDSPGTPFVGNIIPASKLDPVARNLGSQIQTANPMNLDAERAPSSPRHVAKAFTIYDLPGFFDSKSWTGRMLNEWQVSGTMTLTSGPPATSTNPLSLSPPRATPLGT